MKKKSWIIVIITILAIAALVYFLSRPKKANVFEFPNTLTVNNYTKYKGADTLVMVVLNKILLFDTMKVNIYDMQGSLSTEEINLIGFIKKNPFEAHSYNIFVQKTIPVSIKYFLSHELFHLKQMESGDLIQLIDDTKIIYKGDTIYYSKVSYENRPYELEAFANQGSIEKKINMLLYRNSTQ